jgi:hypothetical protein
VGGEVFLPSRGVSLFIIHSAKHAWLKRSLRDCRLRSPARQLGNTQNIHQGVNSAIEAARAWNKTSLFDASLHTSVAHPCKTGYLADALGKCTVCDYTLAMVPGCAACVEPGTCSGCTQGYTFVGAAASPNDLATGTCICDVAHLNDPQCAQCGVSGSCDQCYNGYFPDPATKVCTMCSDNCQVCDSATTCNVCAEVKWVVVKRNSDGGTARLGKRRVQGWERSVSACPRGR